MDIQPNNSVKAMPSNANRNRVKVAIRVRPLLPKQQQSSSLEQKCISYPENSNSDGSDNKQIIINKNRLFTFDHVFDQQTQHNVIFEKCVKDLIGSVFEGYNAAILAYGQTGSGKTYTMGTSLHSSSDQQNLPIIPQVLHQIFDTIKSHKNQTQFIIKASFIEIYNEQIFDLLNQDILKVKNNLHNKNILNTATIRQQKDGTISLVGVTQEKVNQCDEALDLLYRGGVNRTTATTLMNDASSRSHGIFILTVEQHPIVNNDDDCGFITSKFYFVDLAGSERIKKTGASGNTMRQGININLGLLELGNVISALSSTNSNCQNKEQFISYRNSKLTRILQDSLGGNSNTYMIACISPAQSNYQQSLNTIKYAAKAMNIKNKPIINRDPHTMQINTFKAKIAELQAINQKLIETLQQQNPSLCLKNFQKNNLQQTITPIFTNNNVTTSNNNNITNNEIKSLKSQKRALQKQYEQLQKQNKQLLKKTNICEIRSYELKRQCDRYRLFMDQLKNKYPDIVNEVLQGLNDDEHKILYEETLIEEYIGKIKQLEAEIYEQDKLNMQVQKQYHKLKKSMLEDEQVLINKNKEMKELRVKLRKYKEMCRQSNMGHNLRANTENVDNIGIQREGVVYENKQNQNDEQHNDNISGREQQQESSSSQSLDISEDENQQWLEQQQKNYKLQNKSKLQEVDMSIAEQEQRLQQINNEQIALEYKLLQEMKQQYHIKISKLEREKQMLENKQKQEEIMAIPDKANKNKANNSTKLVGRIDTLETELRELRKKAKEQSILQGKVGNQGEQIRGLMEQIKRYKVQKIEISRKIKEDGQNFEKFKKERIKQMMKSRKQNLKKEKHIKKLSLENNKKSLLITKNNEELKKIKKLSQLIKARQQKKNPKNKKKNQRNQSHNQFQQQQITVSNLEQEQQKVLLKQYKQSLQAIGIQEELKIELDKYQKRIHEIGEQLQALHHEEAQVQLKVDRYNIVNVYQHQEQKMFRGDLDDSPIYRRNKDEEFQQLSNSQQKVEKSDAEISLNDLQTRIANLQDNMEYCENRYRDILKQMPNFSEQADLIYSQAVFSPKNKDTDWKQSLPKYQFLLELSYREYRNKTKELIQLLNENNALKTQNMENRGNLEQLKDENRQMTLQYRQNLGNLRQQMLEKYYTALEEQQNYSQVLQSSKMNTNYGHSSYGMTNNMTGLNQRQRKNYERKIFDLTKTNRQLSADVQMWRRKCGIVQQKYHNINMRFAKDKFIGRPMKAQEQNNSIKQKRWLSANSHSSNGVGSAQMLDQVNFMIQKLDKKKVNTYHDSEMSIEGTNGTQFCNNKWQCLKNVQTHHSPITSIAAFENILATAATKSVKIWDIQQMNLIADLSNSGLNGFVKSVIFLPEHNMLASACDKQVHLWDHRNFANIVTLKAHKDEIRTLHHRENILFSAGSSTGGSNSLYVWDIRKISSATPMQQKQKNLDIFTMTSHQNVLYYGTRSHQVRRMNIISSQILPAFQPPHMDTVTGLSVVGKMLVSGSKDKNLRLWSLQSSTNNIRCTTHTFNDYINTVQSDKMFPIFYSASRDGQIKVGTVTQEDQKIKFIGGIIAHTQSVNSICTLDNNGIFISGSSDKCIKIWKPCSDTLGHLYSEYKS